MFAKKAPSAAAAAPPVAIAQPGTPPKPADPGAAGWFAGFGGAKARGGGNWINPGSYVLEVLSLQRQISENPETLGNQLFIAELRVVEVTAAFDADPGPPGGNGGWAKSNQVGETVTSIQNVTKHHKMALSNMKGLLLAIARNADPKLLEEDIPPEEWQASLMKATDPPGNACTGHLIRCTATKKYTKIKREPFTPCSWGPYAGPPPEASADE